MLGSVPGLQFGGVAAQTWPTRAQAPRGVGAATVIRARAWAELESERGEDSNCVFMKVRRQKEDQCLTLSSSTGCSVCASRSLCSKKHPENYKAHPDSSHFQCLSLCDPGECIRTNSPAFSCLLVPQKAGQVSVKWSGRSGLPGAPLGERGSFKDGHRAAE